MKLHLSAAKIVFALAFTAVVIGFSSFRQKQNDEKYSFRKKPDDDTTSRKRNRSWSYWNNDQLNEQMKQLDQQMRKLDEQMKDFDETKIQRMADESMREIDMEKISEEINAAMKNAEHEINTELNENVIALQKIKMEEVKKAMQKMKTELQNQKLNIKIDAAKINADVKKAMMNARRSMQNAKEEIGNIKNFTDDLEKDKLIDKSKAYKIEVKDGELFIDDKKQPKEVNDKYRKYYRSNNFSITMAAGDDFWI